MLNKNRQVVNESEYISSVLQKHIREFRDPGALHCIDSNLDLPEDWDKSKLKILIVFLSTIQSRSVSSTDNVLINLIKSEYRDDVFVDISNLPEKENMELYQKYNLPIIFGSVTHRSWKEFDVIFISNSTVEEKMNLPFMLLHSGIPIWYTQRMLDPEIPLVLLGGNSSDMSDALLGYSDDGKDFSIIDGAFIGYAEGMIDKAIKILINSKESLSSSKKNILRNMFEIPSFLHPEQFIYEYDEKIPWHIKKVIKNPDFEEAPEMVEFNRKDNPDDYPGFERKILHPITASNYRSADIQISWGCSSGGSCTFCKEGHVAGGWREKSLDKIRKELQDVRMWSMADWLSFFSFNCIKRDSIIPTLHGLKRIQSLDGTIFSREGVSSFSEHKNQGIAPVFRITTEYGYCLDTTSDHKTPVLTSNGEILKETKDIEPGDVVVLKPGIPDRPLVSLSLEHYLAGWVFGSGGKGDNRVFIKISKRRKNLIQKLETVDAGKYIKEKVNTPQFYIFWMKPEFDVVYNNLLESTDYIKKELLESESIGMSSFIRGLFESAATFYGLSLLLKSLHHNFIREIQVVLLLKFGIISERIEPGDGKGESYLSIHGHKSLSNFSLYIKHTERKRLENLVNTSKIGTRGESYPAPFGFEMKEYFKVSKENDVPKGFESFCYGYSGVSRERLMDMLSSFPQGTFPYMEHSIANNLIFQKVKRVDPLGDHEVWDVVESHTGIFSCGGILTHNTNYYSNYLPMMKVATEIFPHLSFIAMRADVIGARPDYFRFNSKIGQRRISFGVEGVSNRIRNGYMNKCLSWEELMNACRSCFENRFMEIKFCMINSGLETREDFDELVGFLEKAIKVRDEMGAKTTFRLSFTNMCYYPETPLAWEYRISVAHALEREKKRKAGTLKREDGRFTYFIDNLRKLSSHIRMDLANMTGLKFIYPQLMLDLNRKMTAIMVKASIEKGIIYFRNIDNASINWLLEEVDSRGYKMEDLLAQRPDDFIFSGSYVNTLKRSYIIGARDKLRKFEPNPFCLATVAKPEGRKCLSCGYCKDAEQIKRRTHREFDTSTSIDEVLCNVSMNRPKYKVLVRVDRNKNYAYLNPLSTWNYLWAMIMRKAGWDEASKVYSVYGSFEKHVHREQVSDPTSGVVLCEVLLKRKLDLDKVWEAAEEVKDRAKSIRITGIKEVQFDVDYSKDAHQIVLINNPVQDYSIRDKIMGFGNEIKVISKSLGNKDPKFITQKLDVPKPLLYDGNIRTGWYMVVSLPININPYAYVSSITGEAYKNTIQKYRSHRVLYYKQGMGSCKICGKSTHYDVFDMKESDYCEECVRRAIIQKVRKAE